MESTASYRIPEDKASLIAELREEARYVPADKLPDVLRILKALSN